MKQNNKNFGFNASVFGFACIISIIRLEFMFAIISAIFAIAFTIIAVATKQIKMLPDNELNQGEPVETCN